MIPRKPVQDSGLLTSPHETFPAPPNRAAPEPPSPKPTIPVSLPQAEDSDSDWDVCDDDDEDQKQEEDEVEHHNTAAQSDSLSNAGPQEQIYANLSVNDHSDAPRAQDSANVAESRIPEASVSPPSVIRSKNTNPFLRTPATTQPSVGYNPDPSVWDDVMYHNQPEPSHIESVEPIKHNRSPVIAQRGPEQRATGAPEERTVNLAHNHDTSSGTLIDISSSAEAGPSNKVTETASTLDGHEHNVGSAENATVPSSDVSRADTHRPSLKKQRNEFYQIKLIRWFDGTSEGNPRHSPILIQNANGPCPLLALVNCLVLSTPAKLQTALVEALRTREQISLGLLLDAVFDELTSERRCPSAKNLPDVAELYSFLITLHTGMNVNPRFVPSNSLRQVQSGVEETLPGSFEETREMNLYGTFSIPLIHGWLPHRNESAFGAFDRMAPTYEDAQNVQFREEELEEKLQADALTPDDRTLMDDLKIIKQFLFYWPTQLTAHGLDVIDRFLKPGSLCILFRNDHFSTVLKEPFSNRLMTLVTDAGYSTHDEIVWESLVDINGTNSEFCSGDFLSVSHHGQVPPSNEPQPHETDGWTTVENRKRPVAAPRPGKQPASTESKKLPPRKSLHRESVPDSGPGPSVALDFPDQSQRARSASEQEDHDLALALQLQEEEDQWQRNEAAARRARENDLSEEYLSREARQPPVNIPVRRSGQSQSNPTATQPVAPANESGIDAAPPPYEQAAAGTPFHPPRDHPASEHAPRSGLTSSTQTAPAYGVTAGQPLRPGAGQTGQRRMSARQSLAAQNSDASLGQNRRARGQQPSPGFGTPQARVSPGLHSRDGEDNDRCLMM